EVTYTKLFQATRLIWSEFNPISFYRNFELAAINAIRAVFPEPSLHGDLLYLEKNMHAKLADHGLILRYNTDLNFSINTRMIVIIIFLPPTSVNAALTASLLKTYYKFVTGLKILT
ncbi:hypothetical protein MXB_4527, partial [Myxobolus squamalis]